MTDAQMEEFIQHVIKVTSENYISQKMLYPQFFLVGKQVLPIVCVGMNKEGFATMLRMQATVIQPRAIVAASEAWIVQGETLPPDMKPSQHPKAVEGIYISVEDIRLGIRMYFGKNL